MMYVLVGYCGDAYESTAEVLGVYPTLEAAQEQQPIGEAQEIPYEWFTIQSFEVGAPADFEIW